MSTLDGGERPVRIVLASQNRGKLSELVSLLGERRLELVTLDEVGLGALDVEETGESFESNARIKAEAVARLSGLPAIADDSGLAVDALAGRPGVHSKRYAGPRATDSENNLRLLEELRGVEPGARTARFVCALVLAAPEPATPEPAARNPQAGPIAVQSVLVAEGKCEGHIAQAVRGSGGFGYDPLFVPVGWGQRTLGEASRQEKNELSHRAGAIRALRPQLLAWLARREASV